MRQAVVVGSTPEALAHAAELASHGTAVRYLGTAATPAGWDPVTPLGCGAVRVATSADVARLARAWGTAQAVRDPAPRIRWRGDVRPLPHTRTARAAWVAEVAGLDGLVEAWLGRRAEAQAPSYAERVRARYGSRFADSVLLPWASKRLADPDTLDPAVFAALHAERPGHWMAPREGLAEAVAHMVRTIREADGEILDQVTVDAIEVDGAAVALLTDVGRELLDDGLVIDAAPTELARWLGWPDPELPVADLVQVTAPVRPMSLPWRMHDASADRPFWRLTRPDLLPGPVLPPTVTAHLTDRGTPDAALVEAVLAALDGIAAPLETPTVQRLPGAVPVPTRGAPARHAAFEAALRGIGVTWIGRRSRFSGP